MNYDEARRWKDVKAWAWMPGMAVDKRAAGYRIDGDGNRQWGPFTSEPEDDDLPDLDDPGTKGCLLELARIVSGGVFWLAGVASGDGQGGVRITWQVHGLTRVDGERVNEPAPTGFDTETAGMLAVVEYCERMTLEPKHLDEWSEDVDWYAAEEHIRERLRAWKPGGELVGVDAAEAAKILAAFPALGTLVDLVSREIRADVTEAGPVPNAGTA